MRRGDLTRPQTDQRTARHRYGDGRPSSIPYRLKDKRIERQLVVDPELALGEAYMYGRLR